MLRPYLPSFFSELEKISEDLMTPAVASDTSSADGAPAAPWTRRRGYRRLSQTAAGEGPNLNKQAGLLSRFSYSAPYRIAKTQVGKAKEVMNRAALKTFVSMPHPVQKVLTDPRIMDPSDQSAGVATTTLMRLLKGG
jgi:hypothetical protein